MGAYPFIRAGLASGAALVCGAWLLGCSSGPAASAADTGVTDAGSDAGGDGAHGGDATLCGSEEDALVRLNFQLPSKTFTFDAQAWMIPPGNSAAVPCGSTATVVDCCSPPAPAMQPDCATTPLTCEADLCTVKIGLTSAREVDLKAEVPTLADLSQPQLCDVSLQQLRFAATSTLNVSLPPLQLFLGADGVTDPAAAGAQALGTIPAIPAGSSINGDVSRLAGADLIFATYARTFGTRFTLLTSATVPVPSGSPQPTGTLTLTITGQVSATL